MPRRSLPIKVFVSTLISFVISLSTQVGASEIRRSIQEVVFPQGYIYAEISPDTNHVAIIEYSGYSHTLILLNVETKKSKVISRSKTVTEGFWIIKKQPRSLIWVTNDLLAVDFGVQIESIDLDGKRVAPLAEHGEGVTILGKAKPDQQDSTDLLIKLGDEDIEIVKVDARTGKSEKINVPDEGKLVDWAFDKHGQLRVATFESSNSKKDKHFITNWYKASVPAPWEKLESFNITDDYWLPMYVPEEENSIVVSARNDRDTRAIFMYDTKQKNFREMMAGHPTQDIVKVSGLRRSHFESVTTNGIRPQQVWFDGDWNAVQASVDQVLPNSINRLSGGTKKNVLVFSQSDIDPGSWHILETGKGKLTQIGLYKLAAKRSSMRKMHTLSYPSSDGLEIPAYFTHPNNLSVEELVRDKKVPAMPMVVMVHGGPIKRDYWSWDEDVQLLANEGYIVFQPQFRGSTGFGKKFEMAGYGQWGLKMQDDITAGVEYLIRFGIVDPKRICIYGASYGGYAAMWGLVKTPNLYKCGVSFAGVADINYMFTDSSDSNENASTRELMRFTIGDHQQNREKFELVSPLIHADKIIAPLLLMHGDEDRRVPISHSEKMIKALKKNEKSYEWLEFKDEGHGIRLIHNQVKYFTKLLDFLKGHLKP